MIPSGYGREHRIEGKDSQKHQEESRIDQAMEEVGRAREGEERGERGDRPREDKEQSQEQN